ncbi:MAG TPA: universal stress protein [Syntrophales bacterium]|nr:universal stress protein [Syntrophales bacterium]
MFTPKRILVPTDFSSFSDKALKKAVDIAEEKGAKIYLLHVIDERFQQCGADYCIDTSLLQQVEREAVKTSRERLAKQAAAVTAGRKVEVVYDVQMGYPSEVIIDEQRKKKIDLIVIASQGKKGLKKLLLGSVAERVVRGAKCSVIVVK